MNYLYYSYFYRIECIYYLNHLYYSYFIFILQNINYFNYFLSLIIDSFPFDFEPNGIPVGSKWKGKLSPRSYIIQCERKWKYSFLNAYSREVETSLANSEARQIHFLM